MAAYIGKIEALDETIEPWSSYVERLGVSKIIGKSISKITMFGELT
jgi:hypothetical protein